MPQKIKQKYQKKFYGTLIAILLIILGWAVFFYFISPAEVVTFIGVRNTYAVAFILATICGFSSLTGSTFYIALAALARGGANPWLLGLSGGVGLCISDFAFYFVIRKGAPAVDTHWKRTSQFIKYWLRVLPDWLIYPIVFVYSAFFPVPNDVLLGTLAIGGVPFKKIAVVLFAGDIASTLLLAYLSH